MKEKKNKYSKFHKKIKFKLIIKNRIKILNKTNKIIKIIFNQKFRNYRRN